MKFLHVILPRVLALALSRSHLPTHVFGRHFWSSKNHLSLTRGSPRLIIHLSLSRRRRRRSQKVQKGEQVQIVGTLTVDLREVRGPVEFSDFGEEPQCNVIPVQLRNFRTSRIPILFAVFGFFCLQTFLKLSRVQRSDAKTLIERDYTCFAIWCTGKSNICRLKRASIFELKLQSCLLLFRPSVWERDHRCASVPLMPLLLSNIVTPRNGHAKWNLKQSNKFAISNLPTDQIIRWGKYEDLFTSKWPSWHARNNEG